jgi:hypothetical protein
LATDYFQYKILGKKPTVEYERNDYCLKYNIYSKKDQDGIIKDIIDLGCTDDYVYDLETETGHFQAGIGEIIVKNTDSIFVDFGIKDIKTEEKLTDLHSLKTGIRIGVLCGDLINFVLPKPQNLEYEKTFWPWISLTKKRYVGNLYEFDPNKFYQKSMGIVLKRRDNAPIVKIVVGGIVQSILNSRSAVKAVNFTKKTLKDILSNKYPLDKFIITKTLKGDGLTPKEQVDEALKPKEERYYADRSRIVHAVLADRIAARDPGNKPQSNDRIPYVYKVVKGKPKLQGDRVETPDYLIKNKMKLDHLFYITNQIKKPAVQFLEHVVKNPEKIFENYITREENRRKGKRPIQSFFKEDKDCEEDGKDGNDKDNDDSDDFNNLNNLNNFNNSIESYDSDNNDNSTNSKKYIKKKINKTKKFRINLDEENSSEKANLFVKTEKIKLRRKKSKIKKKIKKTKNIIKHTKMNIKVTKTNNNKGPKYSKKKGAFILDDL